MGDKTKGLHGKFIVRRTDSRDQPGEKHDGCEYFVLDLSHDPHAYRALIAYAASCSEDYPLLAGDLRAKAMLMREAGVFHDIFSQELREAIKKASEEGRAFAEHNGAVVFINDGKNEERWAEHQENACTACGGSGHKDDAANAETFVADVRRFTEAVGCTTDRFNVRQTALYIGLQLEEMAEKLEAVGFNDRSPLVNILRKASGEFKSGLFDERYVALGDREAMLDADVDLAWVTIGSALSQGADVLGAMLEVARANLDKIGPDGSVIKDENGKVRKPEGWRGPDIAPYVLRDDMGAEVEA